MFGTEKCLHLPQKLSRRIHPKFIIVSRPDNPLTGRLIYGIVGSHRELIEGYVKVRGGGWYNKDDEKKAIVLYGSSGDFGEPRLDILKEIPILLKGYKFYVSSDWGKTSTEMDISEVEWV